MSTEASRSIVPVPAQRAGVERTTLEQDRLIGYDLLFQGDGPFLDDQLCEVADAARRQLGSDGAAVNVLTSRLQMSFDAGGGFASASCRSESMCSAALAHLDGQGRLGQHSVLVAEDTRNLPFLAALPWVDGRRAAHRFYAMAAIVRPDGVGLGAVCGYGAEPRAVSDRQRRALAECADAARRILEERALAHVDRLSSTPGLRRT